MCEPCVNQPRGKSEHHGKCSAFLLRLQQQQQQQLQQYGREEEDEDEEEEDNTAIPSTTASHLQLIKSSTLADVKSPIRLPENNASEDLSPLGLYRSGSLYTFLSSLRLFQRSCFVLFYSVFFFVSFLFSL